MTFEQKRIKVERRITRIQHGLSTIMLSDESRAVVEEKLAELMKVKAHMDQREEDMLNEMHAVRGE